MDIFNYDLHLVPCFTWSYKKFNDCLRILLGFKEKSYAKRRFNHLLECA